MRRLVFILIMLCGAIAFAVSCADDKKVLKTDIKVYYADSELNRLLPYEKQIIAADTQRMAEQAIDLLNEGWDDNDKIRRLVPDKKNSLSVWVKDSTAYVDISSKAKENLPLAVDIEKMFLYQIVNTLTDIKGIRYVKFTVDGHIRRDFMGFFDMRETYKHKYPE